MFNQKIYDFKLNLTLKWYQLLEKLGWDKSSVYYLGSSETLPPPLEKDEEKELLSKLNHQSEEVEQQLIEHNLRLVVYIARKFNNTGVDVEDLVSIGTIGLIKAVHTFDVSKNIKLATYASRCIENEILMYLRKNNKKRSEISFDDPLNIDWDGNELKLADVLGTAEDIIYKDVEKDIDRKLLKIAMKTLSEREKKILILRYDLHNSGQTRTQKDVADLLGISQSYISRLEKRIVKKLQQEVARMV